MTKPKSSKKNSPKAGPQTKILKDGELKKVSGGVSLNYGKIQY